MPVQDLALTEMDLRAIGDEDCAAYWALSEALQHERQPDDPPTPYPLFAARCRSIASFFTVRAMLLREVPGAPLLAAADLGYETSGENAHVASFHIQVLAAHRRRGLGRRLLAWAADVAQANGRRLLITESFDRVPSGGRFLERAGARASLESRESQLVLADVDRALLARWQADAATTAAGFELLFWDDVYPEEHIDAFADLCDVMNTAPRGELEVEDQKMTAEKLREFVAMRRLRGGFSQSIVARDRSSGRLVGYTEIFGNPATPTILGQGATAVRPEFRGYRLGRWMKAAMLERVLATLPAARFVRTGNASSNAPMLAINIDLGFKPFMVETVWQLEVEQALAYAGEGQGG